MNPFGPGSLSLGVYAADLAAAAQVEDILAQAGRAAAAGFDGVTVSEHHAGHPGYLPNPVLVSGWVLEREPGLWAAPCPMLLAAHPPLQVIEDLAWLNARHPGRVGACFTPGYLARDFAVAGLDFEARRVRFARDLGPVVRALAGAAPPELEGDRALAMCAERPVPVLATAETAAGGRRAAAAGAGILMAAHNSPAEARAVFTAYREAGGRGPRVLIRRVRVGAVSERAWAGLAALYGPQGRSGEREHLQLIHGDPAAVGHQLAAQLAGSGATALNLRVNLEGSGQAETHAQVERLGEALAVARSEVDVKDQ